MTKVVRTTPIDRSKRTAVKGDIVGEVNIIHGKRKRRLSSNTFNEDYLISSPRTPKKKNKEQKKKTQKKNQKELSESEEEEEQEESEESGDEVVIPLSGNKNKYKIVDEEEDEEEEEEELKKEEEEESKTMFSQELKETERKLKKDNPSKSPLIRVSDGTELLPVSLNPDHFFSRKIVKNVKRLGGEFPQTFDSRNPIIYRSMKIFAPEALRIFTNINWEGKQCMYF